jgi:hypothetical protein
MGGVAVRHHADIDAFRIQQRPLLDVELEVGVELASAHGRAAGVADAVELVAEAPALVVAALEHPVDRVHAGKGAGGDHRRREARAFLVGPVHDLDGAPRFHLLFVQSSDHFQAGQDADDAVVAPAVHLGVEMAAHHDRGQRRVLTLSSRKNIADAVDRDGAASLAAPGDELVAHLAVGVGERDAGEAAGAADADLGGALDRAPVTLRIDLQIHPALRKRVKRKTSIATMTPMATG